MDRSQALVNNPDDMLAQVSEIDQPLIIMALTGALSFTEGAAPSPLTLLGGMHLVVAGVAAGVGASLIVLVLVVVRTRTALANRRATQVEGAPTRRKVALNKLARRSGAPPQCIHDIPRTSLAPRTSIAKTGARALRT